MERLPWVERKFHFDIPPGWIYNIIARLEDAPLRLRHYAEKVTEEQAQRKHDGKWSIKDHIGHLGDLEALHTGRIHDFEDGLNILRPADMTNKATEAANHNEVMLEDLLQQFQFKRKIFTKSLLELDDKTHRHKALHERLQQMMKPVDLAFFTAEHDDHHIESIRQIIFSAHLVS